MAEEGGLKEESLVLLPEVKFRVVARSPEPISTKDESVSSIDNWRNYSIAQFEPSPNIRLYNERGVEDRDFTRAKGKKNWTVDLASVVRSTVLRRGIQYIALDDSSLNSDYNAFVRELPLATRDVAEEVIHRGPRGNYIELEKLAPQSVLLEETNCFLLLGDKYILLQDKSGREIVFITQDEKGVIQLPRTWEEISIAQVQDAPEELRPLLELLKTPETYVKDLGNDSSNILTIGENEIWFYNKSQLDKGAVFKDKITRIRKNICTDPVEPNIIYYCRSGAPTEIIRLDTSGDPGQWRTETARFTGKYGEVNNLQLDPKGDFFLLDTDKGLVLLDKGTLQEVAVRHDLHFAGFDQDGHIRAIDKDGYLVILDPNLEEAGKELRRQRVAQIGKVDVAALFKKEVVIRGAEAGGQGADLSYLQPLVEQYREPFEERIAQVDTMEKAEEVREALRKLRTELGKQGLQPEEVNFVTAGIEAGLLGKEQVLAGAKAQEVLTRVRDKLSQGGFSLAMASETREDLGEAQKLGSLLDEETRRQLVELTDQLHEKTSELFRREGTVIMGEVRGVVDRVKADLEQITSRAGLDDWMEFELPQISSRLGNLAQECPLEASEAHKAILKAREEVQQSAREQEARFKKDYAAVREQAAERIEATAGVIGVDVESFIERVQSRGFANRTEAEAYVAKSPAYQALQAEIKALETRDPDKARTLKQSLQVSLSNAYFDIERAGRGLLAEAGQQMELFGSMAFPVWEGRVKKEGERQVDVVFIADETTRGPGVKAEQILGDVGIKIITSKGKVETLRLYEGLDDEDEWRWGSVRSKGVFVPASYMSQGEYRQIKAEWLDWSQGESSELQKQLEARRNLLRYHYVARQKVGARTKEADQQWRGNYLKLFKDYSEFCQEHNIVLLRRIDEVRRAPETEYANGKGWVPEWKRHWVRDAQTETYLEEMAQGFKMQLDLQEGMLALQGHAGTGKDVLIQMFCNRTHRPYFDFDCTKWTTEFELSEDIILEAKSGASYTVRVPSKVLNGITTPGAVVYFNEFTAMPEQGQIFLHALMDEKRTMTLKTRSGQTIKAEPTVLLAGSMNMGYPGTFDPQFATRSRMVPIEIDYPPLEREKEAGDTNPNPCFSAAEALRIARSVDSLADLTWEVDYQRNGFVKVWNKYVNGIENDAPELNQTQKFDLEVILGLIQFGHRLREDFIKIFEKTREARQALPVNQPLTGREFRRCAYALGRIPSEEKGTANPDEVARQLLEKYFLRHIDRKDDRGKIKTAMLTWTSSKRVAA